MSGAQIIKLQSSDNAELSVEREVAERSILIKNMMEDIGDQTVGEAIPIPNVSISYRLMT